MMGCQRAIADQIAGGADYLLAVKENQPTAEQVKEAIAEELEQDAPGTSRTIKPWRKDMAATKPGHTPSFRSQSWSIPWGRGVTWPRWGIAIRAAWTRRAGRAWKPGTTF